MRLRLRDDCASELCATVGYRDDWELMDTVRTAKLYLSLDLEGRGTLSLREVRNLKKKNSSQKSQTHLNSHPQDLRRISAAP